MIFRPSDTQTLWDWAIEYFANTVERCSIPGIGCRYLRQDGHRCVIGSMFQEENRNDVTFLLNYFGPVREMVPILKPYTPSLSWVTPFDIKLLTEIQVLHDLSSSWGQYGSNALQQMIDLANRFVLSTEYVRLRGFQ